MQEKAGKRMHLHVLTMQLALKQNAILRLGLILMDVFCLFRVVLSTYYSPATHIHLTFTSTTTAIHLR
jgi:hypothetical protein